MPPLHVPDLYQDGVRRLGHLSRDELDELVEILGPEMHVGNVSAVRTAFRDTVSQERGDTLASALLAMSNVRESMERPVEAFARDLSESDDLAIPEPEREDFAHAIARLLSLQSIQALARSVDIQTDHQRVFLESRVLTDLRPVFPSEQPSEPLGMVLVHTLKILYSENGRTQAFYVALDSRDVDELTLTLARASEKSAALGELLMATSVTHLRPEEQTR